MDDDLSWYKFYRFLYVFYLVSFLVVKKDFIEFVWLYLYIFGEVIDMILIYVYVLCCFFMMFIFVICLFSYRL